MNKNFIKSLKSVVLVCTMALTIFTATGCGPEKAQEEYNLALIVGKHSNAYVPDISLCDSSIQKLAERGGNVIVIVSDSQGTHTKLRHVDAPESGWNGMSDSNREKQILKIKAQTVAMINAQEPQTEGSDLLRAIKIGINELSAPEIEGEKDIEIIDSGFSDRGGVTLKSLPDLNIQSFVDIMEQNGNLPDLSDTDIDQVRFIGLSQTCEPQEEPTDSDKQNIKNLWKEVMLRSGLEESKLQIDDREYSSYDLPPESYPPVNTVTVSKDIDPNIVIVEDEPEEKPEEKETEVIADIQKQVYVFPEEKIGFVAEKDTLLDESKADSTIAPYARDLNLDKYSDNEILIIGTTAKVGDAAGCRELSLKRAKKIAEKFVDNGVDPSRIYVCGGGYETEFYCDDHGVDGNLLEYEAKKNRTVILLSMKNEKSKAYMDRAVSYAG